MYWPLNVARRIVPPLLPPDNDEPPEGVALDDDIDDAIQLSPSPSSHHSQHFSIITPRSLHIYTTRPTQVIASLRRTRKSIQDYGRNVRASWKPTTTTSSSNDRGRITIVVETSSSYVLVYHVKPSADEMAYLYVPTSSSSQASASKKPWAPSSKSLKSTFAAASGEGPAGAFSLDISLRLALRVDATLACCLATPEYLLVSTVNPPAIQAIPWPGEKDGSTGSETKTTLLSSLTWFRGGDATKEQPLPHVTTIAHSRRMDLYVWLTSDGQGYVASLKVDGEASTWKGRRFHVPRPARNRRTSSSASSSKATVALEASTTTLTSSLPLHATSPARCTSINAKMGLIAVGREDGIVAVYILRSQTKAVISHTFSLRTSLQSTASFLKPGTVHTLEWTADGLALAVGWDNGWAVWSTWGKLMGHSFVDESPSQRNKAFGDAFMDGVKDLFWGPGGTDLFLLADASASVPKTQKAGSTAPSAQIRHQRQYRQLFVVPHAKSAVAGQHSPDNTRFAFIQLDDALLVYRGSDQPDVSIINPDSDVWQHIKIPQPYVAAHWPIRYAAISPDGLLIAVAGRRGLAHYSSISGRWKTFDKETDEASFTVRGGLQWFEHVLIVACQATTGTGDSANTSSQLRLYSRDDELLNSNLLHVEDLPSPVVLTSLFEDSLLVYTSDNTFYHFLLVVSKSRIELQLCGSITFEGVVGEPERVRGLSWMIPRSQQRFGDPVDDLTVATIIFLVDGKLVLLRPRKASGGNNNNKDPQSRGSLPESEAEEVAYDMQILGDHIEYYWTHLSGIGTLENSLWGYDGSGIKLWLDALTIEQAEPRSQTKADGGDEGSGEEERDNDEDEEEEEMPEYKTIEESLSMPLDFYPLCVVLEKGIIVGIEPEVSMRKSLDFAIFRSTTTTHLFLDRLLRHYLEANQMKDAVLCANSYKDLVYFPHALEILLHAVLEDEADALSEDGGGMTPSASGNSMPTSASNGSIVDHIDDSEAGHDVAGSSTPPGHPLPLLPRVIDFLDHFPSSLSILVSCARKTEVRRWSYLFHPNNLGEGVTPRVLFERCLHEGDWETASGWLIVLHTLSGSEASGVDNSVAGSEGGPDKEELTARLLTLVAANPRSSRRSRGSASGGNDGWLLCRDLLRYTKSMDESGRSLRKVLRLAGWDKDEVSSSEAAHNVTDETQSVAPRPKTTKRILSSTAHSTTLDSVPQEQDENDGGDAQLSNGDRSIPFLSVNGEAVSPSTSWGRAAPSTSPPMLRRSISGSSSGSGGGAGGMYRVGLGGGAANVMGSRGHPWRAGAGAGGAGDAGRRASMTSTSSMSEGHDAPDPAPSGQ